MESRFFESWEKYGFDAGRGHESMDVRAYYCPHCYATDRERLYALFLSERLPRGVAVKRFCLIDFAPAAALRSHLKRRYAISYRSADLCMEGVDDHVDITRMDIYPDESFDAFICSHILEHVREDTKAMAELYRILKAGGWGIAMVPLLLGNEETREDPSKTTEAERWRYFCQGDHVRLYARKDFIARLESVGFRVVPLDVHHFGQENFRRHGISLTSVLYIAEKPERGIRTEQG